MTENSLPTHTIYLSLGSNLGNRRALLTQAIDMLEQRVGRLAACSAFLETKPWGFESEHMFLNAAVRLQTTLSPREVLFTTLQIEREMGRTQKSTPSTASTNDTTQHSTPTATYHDRCIDIDILLYDDLQLCESYDHEGQRIGLTIPHPHMKERDFVMIPLSEIRL